MQKLSPHAEDSGSVSARWRLSAVQWPIAVRGLAVHAALFAIVLSSGIGFVGLMALLLIQMTIVSALALFDGRQPGVLRKLRDLLGGLALGAFVTGMTVAFYSIAEGAAQDNGLLGSGTLVEFGRRLLVWTPAWVAVLVSAMLLYAGWCRPPRPSALHLIVQQAPMSLFAMLIMMFFSALMFLLQDISLIPLRFVWFFFPGLSFDDFMALILVLIRLTLSVLVSHWPPFERPQAGAARSRRAKASRSVSAR